MRDDSAKWTPVMGVDREPIIRKGLKIEVFCPERQTLISGPRGKALKLAGLDKAVGWPEPARSDTYALSQRRDRILVVNGPGLADGWDSDHGLAISDMTDGYAACTLSGQTAMSILKRGTEIDKRIASASVARAFAGFPVLVYAVENPQSFRMHVPPGLFDALWSVLKRFANSAADATSVM